MRKATRLAILAILMATRQAVAAWPDEPRAPTREPESTIPLFLNAPADLDAFWKMLARPDFVLLDGELYRKLRQASEPVKPAKERPSGVVEAVTVTGSVAGDWARLKVELRVSLEVDGSGWLPIQLDGLTLTDVRDDSGELATRVGEGRAWQVELRGRGQHRIKVEVVAPVRSSADGRRIELALPPASSTQVDVTVPGRVIDASAGPNEPIGLSPTPDQRGVRLAARLSPRPSLQLVWRVQLEPSSELPILISAQGEVALEVERGLIRSSSSWAISSIRGTTNQLVVRRDTDEELLGVEVEGKPIQVESRLEDSRAVMTIPLVEPLRPEASLTLLIKTRRPIPSEGNVRVQIDGYAFGQAREQRGVVAVSRVGPLFLDPTPGRGLLRIDPRLKLPERLRTRPDTTLAFEFSDQSYELGLMIEPDPPRLRVAPRTTITVDPRSARLVTRLDFVASQGRPYEVKIDLPAGLEFGIAEPAEVVESTRVTSLDPEAAPTAGADVPRVLTIGLKPQVRDTDAFFLILTGRSAIDPSKRVAIPSFQPRAELSEMARFAIVAERNVSVDRIAGDLLSPQPDAGSPPTNWPWPVRKPLPEQAILWLRSDTMPASVPLDIAVRARSIRHEATLNAAIDRRGVEVVEEVSVDATYGFLSRIDIVIPTEVPSRWEVDGVELAGRESLGIDPSGGRKYRLQLARDSVESLRLRFRYRLPFSEPPEENRPVKVRLEPIRLVEGTSTGRRVVVSTDPRFDLEPKAIGWDSTAAGDLTAATETGPAPKLAFSSVQARPGPVELLVRAGLRAALPAVVASRLWVRTVQRPENDLATSARLWVEARDGSMTIGLPPGSRWVKARVGNVELVGGNVEPGVGLDEFRIRFPSPTPTGPVLVVIDFVVPAGSMNSGWPTLRLLDGGVVQQTVWESLISNSRAGVGTPPGWTDENDWYWAGGFWKRRPARTPVELARWLTGGNARYRPNELDDSNESAGLQGYLFARVGPPIPLRFPILGRTWLLLICSGPVLGAGLLVLARRPPPRLMVGSFLIVAFTAGCAFDPGVVLLAVQSSVLGVALCLAALAMNWAIERTGHHHRMGGEGALILASTSDELVPVAPVSRVGSDESTEIRARPVNSSAMSTADHVILVRTPIDLPGAFPRSGAEGP